jgi:hypothetical protein
MGTLLIKGSVIVIQVSSFSASLKPGIHQANRAPTRQNQASTTQNQAFTFGRYTPSQTWALGAGFVREAHL